MKATQAPAKKPPFRPVTLTLQSQHEVNAIFAVLNHATLCRALGLRNNAEEVLTPFMDNGYKDIHYNICNKIRSHCLDLSDCNGMSTPMQHSN